MTRYKLTIEYKGTDFSGWQRQVGVPSVQATIEEAVEKFSGQAVRLHVAGRTDAGVHALGQVAHMECAPFTRDMSPFDIMKAINAHLRPYTVSIVALEMVPESFHARFSAVNKLYRYRILNRSAFPAVEQGLVWHVKKPLDCDAMNSAAQILVGQHDFSTFRDTQCQAKSPVKTLDRLEVTALAYGPSGREIRIEAEGRSFLHHQVRNMVGALALVGEGKWTQERLAKALAAKDRTEGGPTAPPDGLYLMRVDYH